MKTPLQPIADNLWMMTYPLKMLGADLRRNVTLTRLRSGRLVIHSTAPFSPEDVATIPSLGEPAWIWDGIVRHDTFAQEGQAADVAGTADERYRGWRASPGNVPAV